MHPHPFLIGLGILLATTAQAETSVRRYPAVDFRPVTDGFVASYAENRAPDADTHGLAVNPKNAGDRFAAAEIVYEGPAGTFDLRLTAVAEEDGESVYELVVAGKNLGRRTNPTVTEKRVVTVHTWSRVSLAPGMRLRVLFAGRSNGRYPEGDGFAWSRGRWRALELVPAASASR